MRQVREMETRNEQISEEQQSLFRRTMRAILSVRRAQVRDTAPAGVASTSGSHGWLARNEEDCREADRLEAIANVDDELTAEQLEAEINNLTI